MDHNNYLTRAAWLVQLEGLATLDLGVVGSSSMLAVEITKKMNKRKVIIIV